MVVSISHGNAQQIFSLVIDEILLSALEKLSVYAYIEISTDDIGNMVRSVSAFTHGIKEYTMRINAQDCKIE